MPESHNLDPNRFEASGGPAGGHLAAMLGTTGNLNEFDVGEDAGVSSRVQAVVDYFGPTDLIDSHRMPDGTVRSSREVDAVSKTAFDTIQIMLKRPKKPIQLFTSKKMKPPFLIILPEIRSKASPLVESELLEAALKRARIQVTFYTVKDGGHSNQNFTATRMLRRRFNKGIFEKEAED